ncbi:MAG TPA: c-type cytochrome [Candidatus Saccharimonadales bacterium]|nr:c-type cytochrome [Candidatus Saccharimonadales bacterium]
MKKQHFIRMLSGLSFATIVWLAGTGTLQGQFTQNRDTIKIAPSGFPAEIRKGYRTFQAKCNECHGLDTSLKPSMSSTRWAFEVKRMQAMASSQFNDKDAKAILAFLNYDESHRKAKLKSAASSPAPDSVSPGRQFYVAQSCDTCHSIATKGGSGGPSLTDVGSRLSREQLLKVIHGMKAGDPKSAMPPLPPDTTEQQINDLVDFLMTLKG